MLCVECDIEDYVYNNDDEQRTYSISISEADTTWVK